MSIKNAPVPATTLHISHPFSTLNTFQLQVTSAVAAHFGFFCVPLHIGAQLHPPCKEFRPLPLWLQKHFLQLVPFNTLIIHPSQALISFVPITRDHHTVNLAKLCALFALTTIPFSQFTTNTSPPPTESVSFVHKKDLVPPTVQFDQTAAE